MAVSAAFPMRESFARAYETKLKDKTIRTDISCNDGKTKIKKPFRSLKCRCRRKDYNGKLLTRNKILKFEDILPLHRLWSNYIESIIPKELHASEAARRLLQCDLHGSIIKCKVSKTGSYIGATGIIVRECRNAFTIITKENTVKVLLKEGSHFLINTSSSEFLVYGNNFIHRSAERTKLKIKAKATIQI